MHSICKERIISVSHNPIFDLLKILSDYTDTCRYSLPSEGTLQIVIMLSMSLFFLEFNIKLIFNCLAATNKYLLHLHLMLLSSRILTLSIP